MNPKDLQLPPELDERLVEWARYFKDRIRWSRAHSIEGRFNPYAPGSWDAGWGDPGPPEAILPPIKLPRVLQTHECVQGLPKPSKWALTLGFCYPYLDKWKTLKLMRKYTGTRYTWNQYLDTLDMGRMRVWVGLYK